MSDSIDYLIARLGDEASCERQGDVIFIRRWQEEPFDPPLQLHLTAAQVDRILPEFATAAIGAWSDTDEFNIDDGWKLLIVHLEEDIGTRDSRTHELHPAWAST